MGRTLRERRCSGMPTLYECANRATIHRSRTASLHPRMQLTQCPLRIRRLSQQPDQCLEESIGRPGLPVSGYRVRVKYRPFGVRRSGGRHRQNADRRILAV
ncbi:hypothetical protein BCEP4_1250019 [Burkholderia cepacia]|nr:hypothetical protein BCEP4_1250019 [Burkholderia cepacia]